jgi:hypothetical protein
LLVADGCANVTPNKALRSKTRQVKIIRGLFLLIRYDVLFKINLLPVLITAFLNGRSYIDI